MRVTRVKLIAAAVLLSISSYSIAHHSFQATFDSDVTVTVDGVVKDFRFRNPHVLIYLDVTNDDGSVTLYFALYLRCALPNRFFRCDAALRVFD